MEPIRPALMPGFACPHCQTGTQHLRRLVFARWVAGQFVTIPNFPAWVCDLCGESEYDEAALEQVQSILGVEAALPRRPGRRGSPSRPPSDLNRHPSGRRRMV